MSFVAERNLDAVFRFYSKPLAERDIAFRVLLCMARRSPDFATAEQDATVYADGHEALAVEGLGRKSFDDAARQAVKRAIKVLMGLGIIEKIVESRRGRDAEYRLLLDSDQAVRGSETAG